MLKYTFMCKIVLVELGINLKRPDITFIVKSTLTTLFEAWSFV